ncbi:Fe-S cluster assembly sulfur transfer protein SufU [Enterococcus diestrammenae]|uniref:NifU family SUF system FeS assembly protein n=1 Tax=Enterococcus diestrammenae TaxID=1155073 RepID=A0ABV0F7G7_9ENTE|nr:SUF system NifU family Fe-S cluster assembly protein [Enterococcus diestrammenae]KAF1296847.1 SUF system NifU family Fe-S cluster assembly protein [Enterococcus diestrammenae]
MALSKLDNLYRQVILDHSSHPHHRGSLGKSTLSVQMNNPTCGDVIHLEVEVADGVIKDIAFDGSGCSISTASASMMTDAVIGKRVDEIGDLTLMFSDLVQGKEVPEAERLGEAEVLAGVSKFPTRIKCATLAWKALNKAVNESESGVADSGHLHNHNEEA